MRSRLLAAVALSLLAGCAAETGSNETQDEEATGSTSQAIVNGDAISPENSGVPMIGNWCSSVLLSNRWVLTAAHCVATWENHAFASSGHTTLPWDGANAVGVDSQNRVVVAFNSSGRLGVARYFQNGQLDPSFDFDGTKFIDIPSSSSEEVIGLAIDASDRIVVLAKGWISGNGSSFLVRFLPSGALDTTFGNQGLTTHHIASTTNDHPSDIKIDSRGRIVIGGFYAGSDFTEKLFLARFSANGVLDPSFSGNGVASFDFQGSAERVTGIAIDSTDRIVAVGSAGNSVLTMRLKTDGTRDSSFAGDGVLYSTLPNAALPGARAVTVDKSGRIVVLGSGLYNTAPGNYETRPTVMRLSSSGALDTSFAGDGYSVVGFKFGSLNMGSIAIDAQGRIVLGGDSNGKLAVVRLSADGIRDQTFGWDGVAETAFEESMGAYGAAMALDKTGHAVVVGNIQKFADNVAGVASFTLDHLSSAAWPSLTATMGSQKVNASWVYRHPSLDVAMIYLAAPLSISGNSTTWRGAELWGDSLSSLKGKTIHCAGYGNNDPYSKTGFGTLRSADLTVSETSSTEYTTLPNSRGQIQAQGDSGGACWGQDASGAWRITGINSYGTFQGGTNKVLDAHAVGATVVASWVRGIRGW